jgi:hypothetical protein
MKGEGDAQAEQVILATDEWMQELNSVPFYSKVSNFNYSITYKI